MSRTSCRQPTETKSCSFCCAWFSPLDSGQQSPDLLMVQFIIWADFPVVWGRRASPKILPQILNMFNNYDRISFSVGKSKQPRTQATDSQVGKMIANGEPRWLNVNHQFMLSHQKPWHQKKKVGREEKLVELSGKTPEKTIYKASIAWSSLFTRQGAMFLYTTVNILRFARITVLKNGNRLVCSVLCWRNCFLPSTKRPKQFNVSYSIVRCVGSHVS